MRDFDGFMYDRLPENFKRIIHIKEPEWQNWNDDEVIAWIILIIMVNK